MTAQHLRASARQMKLTLADIDPHIGIGHHQIGVAGEPQSRDVKQTGQALIGNRHVDMFEMDRIAEIFGGTVELLMHGNSLGYGMQAILRQRVRLIQPFRDAIYGEEGTTSNSSMRFPKGSWTKILPIGIYSAARQYSCLRSFSCISYPEQWYYK